MTRLRARRPILLLSAVAFAAVPLLSGCGLYRTHGPPGRHEQMSAFTCTESYTGPFVDSFFGLAWVGTGFTPDSITGKVVPGMVAVGLGLGALMGYSAAEGFKKVKQCRSAKRLLVARQERALAGVAPVAAAPPSVRTDVVAPPAQPQSPPSAVPRVRLADARGFSPKQLNPAGAREIMIVLASSVSLKSIEVDPSDGVSVADIKELMTSGDERQWRATMSVKAGTRAGERSAVLVTSEGRSAPIAVTIPAHAPRILYVNLLSVERSPMQIRASAFVQDEKDDLGASPQVTTVVQCGSDPNKSIANVLEVSEWGNHRYQIVFVISGGPSSRLANEASCSLNVTVADQAKSEGDLKTEIPAKPDA